MYKSIIAIFLLVGIMIPSLVFSKIDIAWKDIGKRTGFDTVQGYNDPFALANKVVNTVLSLLTIIFLAAMLYGGLRWMLAQGDESMVEKAQVAIKAGIIGFVITLSAYAISYFVFDKLTAQNNASTNTKPSGGNSGCCVVVESGSVASNCFPNYTKTQCDAFTNGKLYSACPPKQGQDPTAILSCP